MGRTHAENNKILSLNYAKAKEGMGELSSTITIRKLSNGEKLTNYKIFRHVKARNKSPAAFFLSKYFH